MNTLKRIFVVVLVFVLAEVIAISFKGNDILDRSIVLGLGVDKSGEELLVTAEILSPGNGSEQVGTYSKIVTARGKTVAEAIRVMTEQTGKETSLGQCVLVVFGEEYFTQQDFSDTISYLSSSNSFKESSSICCCLGSAQDLFNKTEALSRSVSLSLVRMLREQAQNVAIPSNVLLQFVRSQRELSCTGYLNLIRYVSSENQDVQNPDKPQGFFLYDSVAVFCQNKFVCLVDSDLTKGFALIANKVTGNTFICQQGDENLTVVVNSKKVGVSLNEQGGVTIKVTLTVSRARADSVESGGIFASKQRKQIPQETMDNVQKQAEEQIQQFLRYQQQYNFDIVNLHQAYRQKYGSKPWVCQLSTTDIPITLQVEVKAM